MGRRGGRRDQSRWGQADIVVGNVAAFAGRQFYFAVTEGGTNQTHQCAFFEFLVRTVTLLRAVMVKGGRFSGDREKLSTDGGARMTRIRIATTGHDNCCNEKDYDLRSQTHLLEPDKLKPFLSGLLVGIKETNAALFALDQPD
jgi:hypothetical protein